MIHPTSGFAPDRWQSLVGPVVMWRPSWEPFSSDDFLLVEGFVADLLFAQYPDVDAQRHITPTAFHNFKCRALENELLNPHYHQSEDVNV